MWELPLNRCKPRCSRHSHAPKSRWKQKSEEAGRDWGLSESQERGSSVLVLAMPGSLCAMSTELLDSDLSEASAVVALYAWSHATWPVENKGKRPLQGEVALLA